MSNKLLVQVSQITNGYSVYTYSHYIDDVTYYPTVDDAIAAVIHFLKENTSCEN